MSWFFGGTSTLVLNGADVDCNIFNEFISNRNTFDTTTRVFTVPDTWTYAVSILARVYSANAVLGKIYLSVDNSVRGSNTVYNIWNAPGNIMIWHPQHISGFLTLNQGQTV